MSDVTWTHRCMIVPLAFAPLARALATGLSPVAAVGMWIVGLSPTGGAPATHFVSVGLVNAQLAALLSDPALLHAACVSAGATVDLVTCTALLAASDVTEGEASEALKRLGLRIVVPVGPV